MDLQSKVYRHIAIESFGKSRASPNSTAIFQDFIDIGQTIIIHEVWVSNRQSKSIGIISSYIVIH